MQNIEPKTPAEVAIERLKERKRKGHGVGTGADYKPTWFAYQISSHGNKHVFPSAIQPRMMHLYSKLEYRIVRKIERHRPRPKQIREQFLLDLEETLEIAEEKKIRHPRVPRTRLPHPFTTDLVIDWEFEPILIREPIFIKPNSELQKPRIKAKREIEIEYWNRRGLTLRTLTEDFISHVEWLNISWFHDNRSAIREVSDEALATISDALEKELRRPISLYYAVQAVAHQTGIEPAMVLNAARHILSLMDVQTTDGQPVFRSKGVFIGDIK